MKCKDCPEYPECRKVNDLRRKRHHCSKAKLDKPITNGDYIRQMNDAELAEFWCGYSDCNPRQCPGHDLCTWGDGRTNGLIKWLQKPPKEKD